MRALLLRLLVLLLLLPLRKRSPLSEERSKDGEERREDGVASVGCSILSKLNILSEVLAVLAMVETAGIEAEQPADSATTTMEAEPASSRSRVAVDGWRG